jgi:hypothetical protein
MGERVVDHVIQVELRTDTTHTLTWLDAALKPKPGMVLLCKGEPRQLLQDRVTAGEVREALSLARAGLGYAVVQERAQEPVDSD